MEHYLEQYVAREGRVTLHTWTDIQGMKKQNFYITGMPGAPIPLWFRKILHTNNLAGLVSFPDSLAGFDT